LVWPLQTLRISHPNTDERTTVLLLNTGEVEWKTSKIGGKRTLLAWKKNSYPQNTIVNKLRGRVFVTLTRRQEGGGEIRPIETNSKLATTPTRERRSNG